MPTYEYICGKCGHEFDAIQLMSAPPLKICPEESCARKKWGRGKVKKKISAGAGLIFKGSGFYITDYRSKNYTDAAKKESASAKPATAEKKPSETKSAPVKAETSPAKK